MSCSIVGCERAAEKRSWCTLHYQRWYLHGDPTYTERPTRGLPRRERFESHVKELPDGCYEWTGTRNRKGYGMFRDENKKMRSSHRVAYEIYVGEIPVGLQIDHLCRNRACVNTDHMEPVTNRENVIRGNLARGVSKCV